MDKDGTLQGRAFSFSLSVITFLDKHKLVPSSIRDQLLRASTSIGANLVEARGSGTKKEFARFFQISLKSANETEYWLSLISAGYGCDTEELLDQVQQLEKMIATSLVTMRNNKSS